MIGPQSGRTRPSSGRRRAIVRHALVLWAVTFLVTASVAPVPVHATGATGPPAATPSGIGSDAVSEATAPDQTSSTVRRAADGSETGLEPGVGATTGANGSSTDDAAGTTTAGATAEGTATTHETATAGDVATHAEQSDILVTGYRRPRIDGVPYGPALYDVPTGRVGEWADAPTVRVTALDASGADYDARLSVKRLAGSDDGPDDELFVRARVPSTATDGATRVTLQLDRDASGTLTAGDVLLVATPGSGSAEMVGDAGTRFDVTEVAIFDGSGFDPIALDETPGAYGEAAVGHPPNGSGAEGWTYLEARIDLGDVAAAAERAGVSNGSTESNAIGVLLEDERTDTTVSIGGEVDLSREYPAITSVPDLTTDFEYVPIREFPIVSLPPDRSVGIDHVEVTQSVQDASNGLPLARGKDTLVRVFVTNGVSSRSQVDVEVELHAFTSRGSVTTKLGSLTCPGDCWDWSLEARDGVDRTDDDTSADFELPDDWEDEENLFFIAKVEPENGVDYSLYNDKETVGFLNLADTFDPTIFYVRVNQGSESSPQLESQGQLDLGQEILRESYPVSDPTEVELGWRTLGANSGPEDINLKKELDKQYHIYVACFARISCLSTTRSDEGVRNARPDQMAGIVRQGIPQTNGVTIGSSDPRWGNGDGDVFWASRPRTVSHEFNHNLGPNSWGRHVGNGTGGFSNPNGCGASGVDQQWRQRYPGNSDTNEVGWSPGNRIVDTGKPELMSYCSEPAPPGKWVSDYRWANWVTKLKNAKVSTLGTAGADTSGDPLEATNGTLEASGETVDAAAVEVPPADDPTFRLIAGDLGREGGGSLDPSFAVPGSVPMPEMAAESPDAYVIVEYDSGVAEFPVTTSFRNPDGGERTGSFAFTVPDNGTIREVRLVTPEGTTLDVLAGDGEPLDPFVTAPPDVPRNDLTPIEVGTESAEPAAMRLLYSPDGETWLPYGRAFTNATVNATFAGLPGGETARFRLLATDGLDTEWVDSGTFAVAPAGPEVSIRRAEEYAVTRSESTGEYESPLDDYPITSVERNPDPVPATLGAPVRLDASAQDELDRRFTAETAGTYVEWAVRPPNGTFRTVGTGLQFRGRFHQRGTHLVRVTATDPATGLEATDEIAVNVTAPPSPTEEFNDAFLAARATAANATEIALGPSKRVVEGDNATMGIVLKEVPQGLSEFNVTVEVDNGTVATPGPVGPGDLIANFTTIRTAPNRVTIYANDPSDVVRPGDTNVHLGTVFLNDTTAGTSAVNLTVGTLTDDSGSAIPVTIDDGDTIEVVPSTVRLPDNGSQPPLAPGERRSLTLSLDGIPAGVEGYEATVALPNTSVVRDPTASLAGSSLDGGALTVVHRNATHVRFTVTDVGTQVQPGTPGTRVALATVNVTGVASGTVPLDVTVHSLRTDPTRTDPSRLVEPTVSAGRLETNPFDRTIGGGVAPPKDLDGDGLHEDVDGDETFEFIDVVALLFAFDDGYTDAQADALDFDGSGTLDFLDVIDLLFRL